MWEGEVREKSYRRAPVYGDSRGTTDKVTHDPGIQGPGIHGGERSSCSGVTEALIKEALGDLDVHGWRECAFTGDIRRHSCNQSGNADVSWDAQLQGQKPHLTW